jgi:splicing factor U2AF subunit
VTPSELKDDEEFEEILEDMKEECGKFGKTRLSLTLISEVRTLLASLLKVLWFDSYLSCAGTLVNLVIPRPRPDGEEGPGVGKVHFLLY